MASPNHNNDTDKDSPATINAAREADYIRFKRYAAWTFVVAAPVLIALPPRKLDLYTAALTGAFAVSASHLYQERTGRTITDAIGAKFQSQKDKRPGMLAELPSERAQQVQAKLREARDAQIRDGSGLVSDELEKLKARQRQDRSLGERIWMGNETEGWKERRLREEQKALDEGKGYWDLITDHIWEVWNWGKTSSSSSTVAGTSTDPSSSLSDSTNTKNKNDKDSGGK